MSRVTHGLCVGATVILLASCGAPAPASVQVREQDAGRTVDLRRGDRLDIVLEGNPTTGYAWEQVDGDSAVIAPAGEPTFTPALSAWVRWHGDHAVHRACRRPDETSACLPPPI